MRSNPPAGLKTKHKLNHLLGKRLLKLTRYFVSILNFNIGWILRVHLFCLWLSINKFLSFT